MEEDTQTRGDVIKRKNPGIRNSVRWKVTGAKRIYHDGLTATGRRSLKRHICEEIKIITSGLNRYPQLEQPFREYELAWTTKEGDTYCPTLVREFYANYAAILENMCKKGEKAADKPNMNQIPVRSVMVDLSDRTINWFLHGPNFIPPVTSQKFYHRMTDRANQRTWLAQVIADGELEWLHNPSARIFKASLTQEARFWWGVVRYRLMPTVGDNIIGENRAVLVASLLSNLP